MDCELCKEETVKIIKQNYSPILIWTNSIDNN